MYVMYVVLEEMQYSLSASCAALWIILSVGLTSTYKWNKLPVNCKLILFYEKKNTKITKTWYSVTF